MNDGMSFRAVVSLSVENVAELIDMLYGLYSVGQPAPPSAKAFHFWRNYEWKKVKLLL